ncbi:hypothetical protein ISS37_00515 [candidate division KSB1 bacterium]|nr:hypothetical protein [candidate division KSB1 bacterium]
MPARKIGRIWRISKRALELWLQNITEEIEPPELHAYIQEVLKDNSEGSDWDELVQEWLKVD